MAVPWPAEWLCLGIFGFSMATLGERVASQCQKGTIKRRNSRNYLMNNDLLQCTNLRRCARLAHIKGDAISEDLQQHTAETDHARDWASNSSGHSNGVDE